MLYKLSCALAGTSLLTLLAACGGGSQDANQSAQANSQGPLSGERAHSMPSGPFAPVERQMSERMMAATGANASETWTRKMIEHHRGAVAMSQVLIDQGGEPRYVEMARTTIEKQQREIGELERILASGINGGAGEPIPFGPVEQRMHQQMMSATGGNISESWARKMIAHHQGAVDMSEALIRLGGDPEVLAMARRTAEDQRREIVHLEAMLRGGDMASAGAPPPTPAARKAAPSGSARTTRNRSAAPDEQAPARPAARAETAPRSTTQPPTPSPTPPCAPEHRALGHC